MADKERTAKFVSDKLAAGNPREQNAIEYLQKHKIIELLDNMTSQLLYQRPADPKTYLIEQLQKLIKSRAVNMDPPSHFDKSNVDAVFSMMDPTKKGMISYEQYKAGLTTLGLTEFDQNPPGADNDKITMDAFGRAARKGISREAATYYDKAKTEKREI